MTDWTRGEPRLRLEWAKSGHKQQFFAMPLGTFMDSFASEVMRWVYR